MGSVDVLEIPTDSAIWDRFFMVAPLAIVGTRDGDGYDLAPKHQAMPLGRENFFCFVCTPSHATYRNVREHGEFTVSFRVPTSSWRRRWPRTRADRMAGTRGSRACRRGPRAWSGGAGGGVLAGSGVRARSDPRRIRRRLLDRRARRGGLGQRELAALPRRRRPRAASRLPSPGLPPAGPVRAISSSLSFPFPAGFRR